MTSGRDILLRQVSEDWWSQQIREWALRHDWCGIHLRRSLTTGTRGYAVLEGVHTLKNSDHDDARGWPDWAFCRLGSTLLLPELKTMIGRVDTDQRRWLTLLNSATGVSAPVWRPSDEQLVRAAFA